MKLHYPGPLLGDSKVTLRPWSARDLGCTEEASHDSRISEATTVPRRYTPEAGLAFIRRQHSRLTGGEGLALAIADAESDEAVGHINLLQRSQRGVMSIGYWLVERKRGNELGLHAVRLLSRWGLREVQLARIEVLIEPANGASIRVLECSGFCREGLLRSYLAFETRRADALIYALVPGDLE